MKILVVDDDKSIKEVINLILVERLKHNAFFAENWGEAVDLLQRDDFDILFTDFRMPSLAGINNGIELVRFLKLNKINLKMKIVLMSAKMDENITSVALAAGADVAVNKFEILDDDRMRCLINSLLIYF